jgi:tetratricopeptide (TPR) repeat protein
MLSVRETLAIAVQHHNTGNLQQAEDLYRQILQAEPQHADALHLLGLVEHQTGRYPLAIEHIGASLRLKPGQAQAHNNLGGALLAHGQLAEALACFRQAVQLKPDYPAAHHNQGNVLRLQGKYEEALPSLQRALRLQPRYANALTCLGLVLQKLGRQAEALSYYQQALSINPDSAELLNHLGSALAELNRHAEAIPHYQRALALEPSLASAHQHLGVALGALGRHEEAAACQQKAIAIDPRLADAHFSLGHTLRTLGRIQESRAALERAIALAPHRIDYFFNLAESHRFAADDPLLAKMEALGKQPLSVPERIFLHFALGKVYADLDRPEDALRQWCEGNRLQRQRVQYHESATLSVFQRIAAVFTPELMQANAGLGDPSALPIFIVGMPRSGSTLIEQILSSHPRVFGAGEITAFISAAAKLDGLDAPHIDTFRAAMEGLTGEQLRSVGAEYVGQIRTLAPHAERVTDKALGNFIVVGLIHLALPNARIVHMRRDPVDTCVSCFSKFFGKDQQHTFDLAELGRYYRAYEELMEHWRRALPPGVMLEVCYEDLVADLEPQARRIIAHCGLDWDRRCLEFHQTERPVITASAAQVRRPIYRSSVGRWRSSTGLLQPLFDALGPRAGERSE